MPQDLSHASEPAKPTGKIRLPTRATRPVSDSHFDVAPVANANVRRYRLTTDLAPARVCRWWCIHVSATASVGQFRRYDHGQSSDNRVVLDENKLPLTQVPIWYTISLTVRGENQETGSPPHRLPF